MVCTTKKFRNTSSVPLNLAQNKNRANYICGMLSKRDFESGFQHEFESVFQLNTESFFQRDSASNFPCDFESRLQRDFAYTLRDFMKEKHD